jgi:arylsulfatase
MDRRAFLASVTGTALWGALSTTARAQQRTPNIILILADDLGYGDLGCYGSKIRTPHLDRMAAEGIRFTDFYAGGPVCSASRAALLTGRYATRVGVPGVLQAADSGGLPVSETTVADVLRQAGYATSSIGKWHLGSELAYLPTNRGFDEYFGIPYSNDMWPLPLLRNTQVIEEPCRLDTLTQRYTEEAVSFIGRDRNAPFFLYLAPWSPHIPLAASERFRYSSPAGAYGDAVEELDWSVGEVLRAVQEKGLDENTLVMFASDNGPWFQGSPGRLRGRKGETYEGGIRVPFIARFPGLIPQGRESRGVASALDILPTLAALSRAPLPSRPIDGIDIWPLLNGQQEQSQREALLFFNGWDLQCARLGRWKLHVSRYTRAAWSPDPPGGTVNLPLPRPELYDLETDSSESYDCAREHPEVVDDMRARMESMVRTFPDTVRSTWQQTITREVEDTPAGALPVRKKP